MSTQTVNYKQFYQGDDKPWMIGSLVVFGSLAAYLVTGSSKEAAHHKAAEHDHPAKATSTKSPGKEEVDEPSPEEHAEAEANLDKAAKEGSPDSHELSDDKGADGDAVTDDEGNTASGEEIKSSMQQAFNEDSPKDAQDHEEAGSKDAKFEDGAPSQTSEAETKPDQKEKPGESHTGTLQSEDDTGPSKVGDARAHAKSGKAPKQAEEASKD